MLLYELMRLPIRLYCYNNFFKQSILFLRNIKHSKLGLNYTKLPASFYLSDDVLSIAKALLGKILLSNINGTVCSGRIIETEAYMGVIDKASHAYGGKRTARTETMYKGGGVAYIYMCYGIHHLINVVTGPEHTPHAVLIRGIEPMEGKEAMMERLHRKNWDKKIGSGPGNLTKALGITTLHNGVSYLGDEIMIVQDDHVYAEEHIKATPRIGVDYAGEDALKPYRFLVQDHPQVSAASFTKNWLAKH